MHNIPEGEEFYHMSSLSRDLENDFLKQRKYVVEFSGGNGVWRIRLNPDLTNYKDFISDLEKYTKTRVYMHIKTVELLSNATGDVFLELL